MSSDSSAQADGAAAKIDGRRVFFILLGLGLFCLVYFSPPWPTATDPEGNEFVLNHQGKAALALFLLAATYWVTEVVPIGVTSIMIGVVQSLVMIRDSRTAFTDFMDPSVWFIFGSLTIGVAFTKTGLTKRMAYKMLSVVGERTSMIYLGCFVMTSFLTLFMAHTAVAATLFPLLLTIYGLYTNDTKPTRFGKGLFMGMAFVAGAGSVITLLGAARGAVAIGFYTKIEGGGISFFQLTYYMAPVGIVMTILLWAFFMVWYKPEQKTIPGLKEEAKRLYTKLGPWTRNEKLVLAIVISTVAVLAFRSFIPALSELNKAGIILVATALFFIFRILRLDDLEKTSWNIILLFGGAMSIGFCLWQTGAADWLAINWLAMFETSHWAVFVLGLAFFVLVMTNLIMNVAAIAISMPVALVCSQYLGVSGEVILFACLVTAAQPFLLLVGAAPNAIAYASKQFTSREFFITGLPASLLLMVVLAIFVIFIWPLMGMPIYR
jgi:sodium-dependent dicarboxylate transporter 2/3/5